MQRNLCSVADELVVRRWPGKEMIRCLATISLGSWTTCLQIAVSAQIGRSDLDEPGSASDCWILLLTTLNGTLMARLISKTIPAIPQRRSDQTRAAMRW